MRTIKFRAWDGKKILDNPKFEFFLHGKGGRAVMMANEEENVEIMQYTGLKDKNDKEIYEGDILNWKAPEGYKNDKGIVFWHKSGCFMVENFYIPSQDNPCNAFDENYELEIIGNIYENSDLLTQ